MDQSQLIKEFLKDELLIFENYLRESVKSDNSELIDMSSYVLNSKGKRLRPTLLLLTAKAFGRVMPEAYHGATTVELLHTATLVHDDVIDRSDKRRGKASLNAVYDNTRAVLVGDFLLSTALAESVKTNNLEVISIISKLGRDLSEGELIQYTLADRIIIDEESYFNVIDKKTASLIRASLVIGAMTGGANEDLIKDFHRIGTILGLCFQIRDDIFDYYTADVGKPTGSDIREGKITLPLIYALNNAPKSKNEEMMEIINNRDYTDVNIVKLFDFAKKFNGIDYAYKKMNSLLTEAEIMIANFDFDQEIKNHMNLFLFYLKDRSY